LATVTALATALPWVLFGWAGCGASQRSGAVSGITLPPPSPYNLATAVRRDPRSERWSFWAHSDHTQDVVRYALVEGAWMPTHATTTPHGCWKLIASATGPHSVACVSLDHHRRLIDEMSVAKFGRDKCRWVGGPVPQSTSSWGLTSFYPITPAHVSLDPLEVFGYNGDFPVVWRLQVGDGWKENFRGPPKVIQGHHRWFGELRLGARAGGHYDVMADWRVVKFFGPTHELELYIVLRPKCRPVAVAETDGGRGYVVALCDGERVYPDERVYADGWRGAWWVRGELHGVAFEVDRALRRRARRQASSVPIPTPPPTILAVLPPEFGEASDYGTTRDVYTLDLTESHVALRILSVDEELDLVGVWPLLGNTAGDAPDPPPRHPAFPEFREIWLTDPP